MHGRRSTLIGVLAVAGGAAFLGLVTARIYTLSVLFVTATLAVMALVVLVRQLGSAQQVVFAGRTVLWWTIVAFAAVVGILITNSAMLSGYLGGDAFTYHFRATALLRSWQTGLNGPFLPSGRNGFYYLLAGLYWLVGPRMAAGLVLNAMIGAVVVPLMTETTRRLFGATAARYTTPLVVFLPSFFVWTSQLLKEATILFLVVRLNCAVRMVARVSPGALCGSCSAWPCCSTSATSWP